MIATNLRNRIGNRELPRTAPSAPVEAKKPAPLPQKESVPLEGSVSLLGNLPEVLAKLFKPNASSFKAETSGNLSARGFVGTLTLTKPEAAGTLAAGVKDGALIAAGTLVAKAGQDGQITALAALRKAKEDTQVTAQVDYQDKTTAAGILYSRKNEDKSLAAHLEKQLDHSTLEAGAAYTWSPAGDRGKIYGTWKTDETGGEIEGYRVHGEASVGMIEAPGQGASTYASGKVVGSKENSSFYLGLEHRSVSTQVQAGFEQRF